MTYSLNFDEKLAKALNREAKDYKWDRGRPVNGKSTVDGTVDVAGSPLKAQFPRVYVEVELKKDNPVENVVKVWRFAANKKNRDRILFVQAFSNHHQKTKSKQYNRAVFVGEQMQKDQRRANQVRTFAHRVHAAQW